MFIVLHCCTDLHDCFYITPSSSEKNQQCHLSEIIGLISIPMHASACNCNIYFVQFLCVSHQMLLLIVEIRTLNVKKKNLLTTEMTKQYESHAGLYKVS